MVESDRLVDIGRLPLRGITRSEDTLQVGALTTMEELAADPTVAERLPFVREALLLGASVQLRNMATIGGNLLQRTRCRYFRDPACRGLQQAHAGVGLRRRHRCGPDARDPRGQRALHRRCTRPTSCVPLVALDAVVHVQGVDGQRSVPLTEFYVLPGDRPDVENVLGARRADHAGRRCRCCRSARGRAT